MRKLASLLALAFIACAGPARAASITVDFKPEEGKPAEYKEVTVQLVPRPREGQKTAPPTSFRSTEKAFRKTFEGLPPGPYDVWTFTGPTPFLQDADTPGRFRYFFFVELKEDGDHQTVKVQYRHFDPATVRGNEVARGKVTQANGKPVAGLRLRLATSAKGVGTVVVARATTGDDGSFEATRLVKGSKYTVIDAEDRRVGELVGGDGPATFSLAPVVGDAAPDFDMTEIASGRKLRLSGLRGKVVVIDFWATWCGPCQEPMAKMQTYRGKHPGWGDKVELVALSIDDKPETAARHLAAKGWDKTLNAWAGEGAFESAAARAYKVDGIPRVYIIAPDGTIAATGHPASVDVPEVVNRLLAAALSRPPAAP